MLWLRRKIRPRMSSMSTFYLPGHCTVSGGYGPLHDSVLAANPELQPIYDLIQQHNAAHTAD